jgi:hypothetical protein
MANGDSSASVATGLNANASGGGSNNVAAGTKANASGNSSFNVAMELAAQTSRLETWPGPSAMPAPISRPD